VLGVNRLTLGALCWKLGVGSCGELEVRSWELNAERWALFVVGSRLGVERVLPFPIFCIYSFLLPIASSVPLPLFALRLTLRVRGDLLSCPNEVSYQGYSCIYKNNYKSNLYRLWNLRSECFHEILFHCLLK